jgi:hypothetical protein
MDHLVDAPIANILILAGVIFLAVGLFGRVGGFIGSIFGNIEAGKNSRVMAGVLGVLLIVGGGWLHQEAHTSPASAPNPSTTSTVKETQNSQIAAASPTTPPSPSPEMRHGAPKAKALVAGASTNYPAPSSAASMPAALAPKREPEGPTVPVTSDDPLVGTWTNLTPDPEGTDSISSVEIAGTAQGLAAHIWYHCPAGECDRGIHKLAVSGDISGYDYHSGERRFVGSLRKYSADVMHLSIDIFEPGTPKHWHHNRLFVRTNAPQKMRDAFARYLGEPGEKAFAMTPNGAWAYRAKESSTDYAVQIALRRCEERHGAGCRIVLLNNDAAQ